MKQFFVIILMSFGINAFAAPGMPGALRVLGNTSSSVEIAWQASSGGSNFTYGVFRNNYFIGHTQGLSYKDTNVRNGDSYEYSVRATDWTSISDKRTAVVTVGSYDVVGAPSNPGSDPSPRTPENLRALNSSANNVQVAWNRGANPTSIIYSVFRNNNFLGTTRGQSFVDRAARNGDRYTYTVKATNWKTLSSSAGLTVTVGGSSNRDPAPPAPVPAPPPPAVDQPGGTIPVGRNWYLEWQDEFNGSAGSRPSAPWNFDLTYDGGEKPHRQAVNTKDHAFLDGSSHLKMRAVRRNGRTETSMLRSSHFDKGDNILKEPPTNLLLDPRSGPLFIETAVRLDHAYQSEDAWWAFWLMPPDTWNEQSGSLWSSFSLPGTPRLEPYDGNAQTGMEVDIFEYVPYLGSQSYGSRNGFNMAAYTGLGSGQSQHMDTPDNGFVGDINSYLGGSTNINLTDGGYHKIGMYWDDNSYKFFIDDILVWVVTDQRFITRSRANALVLSWEVENGTWGDDPNKTFASNNKEVYVLVDYVKVYRQK